MMPSCVIVLALCSALTAAAAAPYDGFTQVVVPQKRAALVLDRLLIALQKALRDGDGDGDGPRTAPLRLASLNNDNMMGESGAGDGAAPELLLREPDEPRTAPLRIASLADATSTLQRRGQGGGGGRGRVLRCYFNAVTCF